MVIGVTGGVGSGKTTFSRELAKQGASWVDADAMAKNLLDEDPRLPQALRKEFGPDMFDASGRLQRRRLARQIFSDPLKVLALNRIMWPPLLERIRETLSAIRERDPLAVAVLDMAVLFESGADVLTDQTVLVCASRKKRMEWVSKKRGWSRGEFRLRMQNQFTDREKCALADVVVRNQGSVQDLRRKARDFFRPFVLK